MDNERMGKVREIKFRGKRCDNDKWYYGSYLFLILPNRDWTGKATSFPEPVHYIVDDQDINYAVRSETLGQYTGFKDKNGAEVYEGDILSCRFNGRYVDNVYWEGEPDAICEVFWDYNAFRLKAKGEQDQRYADFYDFVDNFEMKDWMLDLHLKHSEVIGNIYDNPELMEVK